MGGEARTTSFKSKFFTSKGAFFSRLPIGRNFELTSVITQNALPILGDRVRGLHHEHVLQATMSKVQSDNDAGTDHPRRRLRL
jgi:hypothetical protein